MPDDVRDPGSCTAAELAALTPLELADLAMRAEEASASLWREHEDDDGHVPEDVERRAAELSALSGSYARLARRTWGRDDGGAGP